MSLVEQGDFLIARVAEVKNYGAVLNLIEYEGFTKIEDEIGKKQSDEVSKIKKTNRNLKEIMVEFEKAAKDGVENLN